MSELASYREGFKRGVVDKAERGMYKSLSEASRRHFETGVCFGRDVQAQGAGEELDR